MSGGGSEEGQNLEYTPTWVVAVICTMIVAISLALERLLHQGGIYFKKKGQKPLFEALQKVKEELMLLGFISLLLTVSQSMITKICVPERVVSNMFPCALHTKTNHGSETNSASTTEHFQKFFSPTIFGIARRHLSEETNGPQLGYCAKKGKVPLLSVEAIHQLDIFIFVLAIVHVVFCVLTVLFGRARIYQWQHWESSIAKEHYDTNEGTRENITNVNQHTFIQERFLGIGKDSILKGWVQSFFKQFYASMTKSDYATLRSSFIMTHCKSNPKFNFHKYMLRALEDDFKIVVGISWYLWAFVVIFLLLNINGWHTYFWIAFIPFVLQYGWDSCIMEKAKYIVPRLVIGVIIQVLCSYSTLPLYAIVTQMGSHYKKAIFDEHVQVGILGWAGKVRKRNAQKEARDESTNQGSCPRDVSPLLTRQALLKDLNSAREGSNHESFESGSPDGIQLDRVPYNGATSTP